MDTPISKISHVDLVVFSIETISDAHPLP